MAETYCGKDCSGCHDRESLNCPGCKAGPGKLYGGSCTLARCVREKGHETCETCGHMAHCGTFIGRYQIPDERRRKLEEAASRKAALAKRAPILGKWLWIMFWLVVPNTIGSLMSSDAFKDAAPVVFTAGEIIQLVCSIAYGAILLKLAPEEARYQTAGACTLLGALGSVLSFVFPDGEGWTLIFSIPLIFVSFYGQYHEYMGHSAVLYQYDVDGELAQNWENLWKWDIGLNVGLLCSAFLIFIPFLGALIVLAIAIGILVVSILKLVYLYRTAKAFRDYVAV